METKTRLLSYALFLSGVAVLTAVALYYWHTLQVVSLQLDVPTPRTVSALPRVRELSGQRAIENIQQLHGVDIQLIDGYVAIYGNQNVVLWVADAGNINGAAELTELMREHIDEGRSPFQPLGDFELEGRVVYALDGLGQAHYYWQAENLVLWLAADVELAEGALPEVVSHYQ